MFAEGSLKQRGECLTSVRMTEPIWENVISRLNPWARARREDVEGFDQPAGNTRHDTRVQASSTRKEMIWAFLKARRQKRKVSLENGIDALGSFEESADVFGPMGGAGTGVALLHQLEDDGQNISPSKESLNESLCESDLTDDEDGHLKKKARLEQEQVPSTRSRNRANSMFATMAARDGYQAHPNDRDIAYFEKLRQEVGSTVLRAFKETLTTDCLVHIPGFGLIV